jgi:hypothetical protein
VKRGSRKNTRRLLKKPTGIRQGGKMEMGLLVLIIPLAVWNTANQEELLSEIARLYCEEMLCSKLEIEVIVTPEKVVVVIKRLDRRC